MIRFLERYYSILLVLALPAPFWILGAHGNTSALRDAGVWTAVLLGCWLLITKRRGYQVRGDWRSPTPSEANLYRRLLLGAVFTDIACQAILFRDNPFYKIEIVKNFGLQAVFHPAEFELFHFVLYLYFLYVFLVGARFFRFSNGSLDRVWLASASLALGGATALFSSRLFFGGAYDTIYFSGAVWTPGDWFVHAAFLPPIVLIVSYLVPAKRAASTAVERTIYS